MEPEKQSQPFNINVRKGGMDASRSNQNQNTYPGARPMRMEPTNRVAPTAPKGASAPTENDSEQKLFIRILDKLIGLAIFMLFFGVPLFFTGLTQQGIIFEKQIYFYFWLLLGLVVWVTKGVITGEMNIKRTPLDWPILGFWLSVIAATIFSVDRWHSFWGGYSDPSLGLMGITAYIIAYYFLSSNMSLKRLRTILVAIISSGFLVMLWTILAIFGVHFLPSALDAYAPLSLVGSVTGLGMLFSLLIPVITVAVLRVADSKALSKFKKISLETVLLISLVLDMFLILALYNYVPWLGLFIGVAVFLIFILAKIVTPKSTWIWLPMVLFVLIMVLRLIGNVPIAKVQLPLEVSLNYKTSTDIAVTSLKHKLLVGSGPATYGYDFSLNRPQDFNLNALYSLRFSEGTGILAEALPTVGILGTIFLLILILVYIGSQFYMMYRDKEMNKLYSLGFLSASVIILVDAISVRMDGGMVILGILFATLALAVSSLESKSQDKSLNLSLKASPKFALALAFVFMVVSAGVAFLFVYLGKVYASDIYAKRAATNISTNSDVALKDMSRVISFNPQESQYYVQLGQYYMALANQEAMKDKNSRDVSKIQSYLNNSIAVTNQAKKMSPNNVGTVESLALIYENAGLYVPNSLKLATDNYKRAQELEPFNPVYYLKLGQLDIAQAGTAKDADQKKQLVNDAKDMFQKSVDEKKNYPEGYYQLALAYEALNQLDQAIDSGEKAASLTPKNINYLLSLGRMYEERNKNDDLKTAEQYYLAAININNKDVNGHFYLGLLYEKEKNKDGAKAQYQKVIDLLSAAKGNDDTITKLKKMISNVDAGVANTAESLGLAQAQTPAPAAPAATTPTGTAPAPATTAPAAPAAENNTPAASSPTTSTGQ